MKDDVLENINLIIFNIQELILLEDEEYLRKTHGVDRGTNFLED